MVTVHPGGDDGVADLFQMLVGWLVDRSLDSILEKQLAVLEPVILKALTSDNVGVLLQVQFYRGSEGQKHFHAVMFLATGLNPNTAYQTSLKTGGVSKTPPKGMLFDKESSCMVWCCKRSATVGPTQRTNKMINWPDYEMVIAGNYPTK